MTSRQKQAKKIQDSYIRPADAFRGYREHQLSRASPATAVIRYSEVF